GPRVEVFGIHADAIVGAEDGELLAEIEQGAKFVDGAVALAERGGVVRLVACVVTCAEEPAGELRFAAPRARRREQFEETGAAEDVEIERVGMMRVEEALTGFSAAPPSMFEAGESALVEGDRAAGAFHFAFDAGLPPDECNEERNRGGNEPGVDATLA